MKNGFESAATQSMAQIQCFNRRKDSELWVLLLMYGLDKKWQRDSLSGGLYAPQETLSFRRFVFCVLILQFVPFLLQFCIYACGDRASQSGCCCWWCQHHWNTLPASKPANQSANQQLISSSFTASFLICKPMQSSNDLIRVTLTLAGSCAGTVNEVAHCDEWMGEGFPWWNSPTCTRQTFG